MEHKMEAGVVLKFDTPRSMLGDLLAHVWDPFDNVPSLSHC